MVMSLRKHLLVGSWAASASIALSACATLPEASSPMPLGATASAPTGYLDYCARQPLDCGGAPAAVVRTVAETELTRRGSTGAKDVAASQPRQFAAQAGATTPINWSAAFAEARARREMASRASAAIEQAAPLLRESYGAEHNAPTQGAMLQRVAYRPTDGAEPATGATAQSPLRQPPQTVTLTAELWMAVTKINDKVNRALKPASDSSLYGVTDRWATPIASGVLAGDCEDYVLEKRRALIAAGIPQTALSIAIATTGWGEHHAVLLIDTDRGAYVLDSLTPWILPWQKANLAWHERQVSGSAFRWAMVNALEAPSLKTTSPAIEPPNHQAPSLDSLRADRTAADTLTVAMVTGPLALRGRL